MIQNTLYSVPLKNLNIKLTLKEDNTFWQTYPGHLGETIKHLTEGITHLSAIINTLYSVLQPLGLVSIEVVDIASGSGMQLFSPFYWLVAEKEKPKSTYKKKIKEEK